MHAWQHTGGVFAPGSRITGAPQFFKLSALSDTGAGWLANDTLVLTVDVNVQREDMFHLETGAPRLWLPLYYQGVCQARHAIVCVLL
jgi:hypothetical protein